MEKPTTKRIKDVYNPYLKYALAFIICFYALSAYAQLPVPFTPRLDGGSIKVKGDIVFIGNSVVTGAGLPQPYNGNGINNNNEGVYINVASGGDPDIFSSSSAELLTGNSCKRILYAGLYWASVYPLEEANNSSVQFEGTPRFEDWNEIKFKLPGGNFIDLEADNDPDPVGEEDEIIFDGFGYYGPTVEDSFKDSPIICYKNVTNLLQGLTEADGEYTVANLRATRGRRLGGCSAGWTLVVIYESPLLPSRYIALFDGYAGVQNSTELDIPVSGFQTLPAPLPVNGNIAVAALEGDIGIGGDSFQFKANSSPNFTVLSDAINQPNNFFNSSITINGNHNLNRNPASTNTLGMDINNVVIPNPSNLVIPNDETAGDLKLTTNGDGYGAFAAAFSVEIIEPDITLTKIVEDEFGNNIGGQEVDLGQELTYVIGFQNTGNDDATDFTIRDILPINTVLDYPNGLTLPPGVTVESYDPATRELIFRIDDSLVEEFDPAYEIRIQVTVVESCSLLVDVCSDLIQNQAFATYGGVTNPGFVITDDPSYSNNTGCLLSPQTTNFLADLDDCIFEEEVTLCGNEVDITAASGYTAYTWSTDPGGTNVIGNTQTITVDNSGTYYVRNTAEAPCQSIDQIFNVTLFGDDISNPVIPYADEVVVCPNDGKELPNIFLCGADDSRLIETNITDAISIIWDQLDESSCAAVTNQDCANESDTCTWNEVGTGPNFDANTAGQYRLTINYDGGCFVQFYFNVYQNLLDPTVTATDILCNTNGSIIVNGVPSGYEYSIDGTNYQTSNTFSVNTAGFYTVYVRQIGVSTNPCIFTTPDVQVRARNFSVSTDVTQPFCNGEGGNIQIAINDADPQYYFSISQGGTLVNNVGPIVDNNYSFNNLNPGTYTIEASTDDGCTYTEDITITEPPLLTVNAALTTPLSCEDGEITIYPEGGTTPYYYFINSTEDFQTSATYPVSSAGTYTITVVDANNCSASTTLEVEAIGAPNFNVSTTDITCASQANSGSIAINVTNPNGNAISYSIDGGLTFSNTDTFNNLPAGDYDVVVQYSQGGTNCETITQSVTINTNSEITAQTQVNTNLSCVSEASVSIVNVSGGTPPYTYSLNGVNFQASPDFNNLSDGSYTFVIRDDIGCTTVTDAVVILPLNPITGFDINQTPVTCPSNTANLSIDNVNGGTGVIEYQIIAPAASATPYQTSNTFNNLVPDTYTIQVRDENECTYVETYTISPITSPTLATTLDKGLDCTANPDAEITGTITGNAPITYEVSLNGGVFNTIGTTTSSFTYSTATPGDYTFQITDANGCTAQSTLSVSPITNPSFSVAQTQDILCHGDNNGAIDISIDPNLGTAPFSINVFNESTGTNYGSQTSSLPAGDYRVTVTDANSCTDIQNITINEPNPINVNYDTIDISCTASGISQGSIIINSVSGGTAPYNYFVTGNNGYSNSEFNTSGTTSVSFNVVDFGLYQINVIDANGCSVLEQDVLVASPPTDLDINVNTTANCISGGEAVVSIGSTLVSSGPFFFSIYEGPSSVYPNPPGSWIPEDAPGSQSATFTNLIPDVQYTFIVYDASTNCSYYEPATVAIPTNSTLTLSALNANNITCTGNADGNVSFNVNSSYGTDTNISYEVLNAQSLNSTGITGTGTVPANGTLNLSNVGPLPFGNYIVVINETSGPNAGCGVVTDAFNITESQFPLDLAVSIDANANCNPNSGQISAVASNGTPPYEYQITTTATAPAVNDTNWASASTFNVDANSYYIHVKDAYNCVVSSPVIILPQDPAPTLTASVADPCTAIDGTFEAEVNLASAGIPPYSLSINGGGYQNATFPYTLTNLSSGSYSVSVLDANGCESTTTIDIDAPLQITPNVTALPSCLENDGEIQLTVNGGSGDYTVNMLPLPTSASLSGLTVSGLPSGSYDITVLDNITSCSEVVTVALSQAVPPSINISSGSVTCFGDNSGSVDLSISGYSGAFTYDVLDELGNAILTNVAANTATAETISGLSAGNYTIEITATAVPFCSAATAFSITSPVAPLSLNLQESAPITCIGADGSITASASGGWGNYEYELTGPVNIPYSSNATFNNLDAGTYSVNVRDEEGCVISASIDLSIPDPITATFAASHTTLDCFGDQNASITVTNVTGGQGSNYSYTLNSTAPTTYSSGPQISNVFNNLSAGTYSITITDGFGCIYESTPITINNPNDVTVNLNVLSTPTCATTATLRLSASGGTGPYEYSTVENFGSVLGSFANSTDILAGPGLYTYFVRDANGCIANVSNAITVEDVPPLTLNLNLENASINCAGDTNGVIVAEAQGGLGNYDYTIRDDQGNDLNLPQATPGVFTNLAEGTYEIYVESGDCDVTSSLVTVSAPSNLLDANAVVNNITCAGANDGRIEIIANGGTGQIQYAISPQLNQFFNTNTFENLAPGDYEILVQDVAGCYLTFNTTITEPEPVVLSITPNSILPEVCSGDLNGEFSIQISGGTLPYSVSLDNYDGPYTQGGSTQSIFDFDNLEGGDHTVFVRDSEGCESEWNITFPESVSINPSLLINYECLNNSQGNSVTVELEGVDDYSEYDFSLNGNPFQLSNTFTNIPPGEDNFIEIRHSNGCIEITEPFDIEGYEPLELILEEGEINEIIATVSGGDGNYEIFLNDESQGTTSTFFITESGTYTVTVYDGTGCFVSASILLEYVDICIPNYFTPNGDGVTDTWAPGCADGFPSLTFDIFDRYGRKVATYSAGEYWDGRYNNQELPTGDYWYVVKTNHPDVDKEFVGHFTLYR